MGLSSLELSGLSKISQAKALLSMSRSNIESLKGMGYCRLGALEKRQIALENALYGKSNASGNLGMPFVVPVVVAGAMGVSALWAYIVKQWADTKEVVEYEKTNQMSLEKGIDPTTYRCPIPPKSWSDDIIKTVKGVIILGAVAMALVIVYKSGMLKGVFKK